MPKRYEVIKNHTIVPGRKPTHFLLNREGVLIAEFFNYGTQNSATNAQKVCDLLNETSRSQGKHT